MNSIILFNFLPGFSELGDLAKTIGTLNAVLIFVVFVLAIVVFYLLRMLQNREKSQDLINNKMIDFLIGQSSTKSKSENSPSQGSTNNTG